MEDYLPLYMKQEALVIVICAHQECFEMFEKYMKLFFEITIKSIMKECTIKVTSYND